MKISASKFIGDDAARYQYFLERDFTEDILTRYCWSPVVWQDGKRAKKNFIYAECVALDFDSGKWSIQDCVDVVKMQGTKCIIGTTRSHQREKNGKACDRFRLIYPLAKRVTDLKTYEYNVKSIISVMPADSACQDGARFFFPCLCIAYKQDGKAYPVVPPPSSNTPRAKRGQKAQERVEYEKKFKEVPKWMRRELARGIPEGQRNTSAFRFALHLKERGIDTDTAARVLSSIVQPGFTENELHRTIHSAYRYSKRGVY